MLAINYRRFPEALALQLQFDFGQVMVRQVRKLSAPCRAATQAAAASIGIMRPRDAEDIPVGAIVRTPTGARAKVEGYRGSRRDHRIRLVCRYTEPANKRYDVVLLAPELVTIIQEEA